jgi:hypothetical protein
MPAHLYVVPKGASLVLIPGNIDLLHRPAVHNPDGTISSVFSMTFGIEKGRAILLPGVIHDAHGRWITSKSRAQVLAAYKKTGQFLGIFRSEADANRYAKLLHQQQAALSGSGG